MNRPPSIVVLNPAARGGAAARSWRAVSAEVARHSRPDLVELDPGGRWIDRLHHAMADGVRVFLAAGGDGTIHALVNALLASHSRCEDVVIGAVGLGSSNDFHKPSSMRIPLRVDPQQTRLHDVGVARYRDAAGTAHTRYFLVSASLGFTAETNAAFNAPWLRGVKRRSSHAAIAGAAVRTLWRRPRLCVQLAPAGQPRRTLRLSNLSIMKTPYLSGWMRFDTPVAPDDGHFAVNALEDIGAIGVLRAALDLSRGRFLGPADRHHWRTASLSVDTPEPVALELDGEIVEARAIDFNIHSTPLRCCA